MSRMARRLTGTGSSSAAPVVMLAVAVTLAACGSPPTIPAGESATCADGSTCRSILVGRTLIRGHAGQKLFTDLITDDPAAFVSQAALEASLKRAASPARFVEWQGRPRPPAPRLCPQAPSERSVPVRHDELQKGRRSLACAAEYQAGYLVVFRADGSVTCIENDFSDSCT